MLVKGQDVSTQPTDDIVRTISADGFPTPFPKGVPSFGGFSDKYAMMPEKYYETLAFLQSSERKLAPDTLAKVETAKTLAEEDFRRVDANITDTIRYGRDVKASPSSYVGLLVAANKALGTHYHASGDQARADEHFSAAIDWYDAMLQMGNRYAAPYDKDNQALVLEEGQRGILKDAPVGTLNIQTCIACVVEGADHTKQLVHFNKGANFRKVLDEIRKEMPGPYTITPIGASLPEKITPYNHEVVVTSNDNVKALVEAFKDQPDVRIDSAWLLKKGTQKVTAIVVDPKKPGAKVALPNNTHPNEVLERGMVCCNPKDSIHDIELCFDMRKSPARKPLILTTEQIDVHNGNIEGLGGKQFLKIRADKISPGSYIMGPQYERYVVLGKLQKAHETAIATVAEEMQKTMGPVIDHCQTITIDGTAMNKDAAMGELQKHAQRMPKFIGEGQVVLNKQLVQAVTANKDTFSTDGHGGLAITTSSLNTDAASTAQDIRSRAMASGQIAK